MHVSFQDNKRNWRHLFTNDLFYLLSYEHSLNICLTLIVLKKSIICVIYLDFVSKHGTNRGIELYGVDNSNSSFLSQGLCQILTSCKTFSAFAVLIYKAILYFTLTSDHLEAKYLFKYCA